MLDRLARLFAHLHPHLFTSHRDNTRRYFAHHDMPYPLDCALLGHRPVWVTIMFGDRDGGYMECARCTLRPVLTDEARQWTAPTGTRELTERALREGAVYWPVRRAESHLEIGSRYVDRFAVGVSIGTAGSETPIDAHLIVPWWRGFYLGTSLIGRRLAHRRSRRATDRDRYTTRVWELSLDGDQIRWEFGARKHESSSSDPWWMHGSWSWRDALQGRTVHVKDELEPVELLIPMPEGDYPAIATPYRQTWTRPRFARPTVHVGVEFDVPGGIPNGRHKYGDWDSTHGFAVSAERWKWPLEGFEVWAPLAAAARIVQDRERYASADWTPPEDARNPRMVTRT